MSAQDRAIQKLARELAGIKREVVSWRGPQADYTSIENGGNFTFKDGLGNVTAIVGGQDDGSNTIRHVDGPTPAVPSGLTAHVDGPIVQVSWDGSFETDTTYDWSFLEVEATGPSAGAVRSTINDATGGSATFTATESGLWTVVARSVSRADKRSLDGDAGTVEVKLVDIDGAIEAVQDSANGKNQVHYSSAPPTPADPGIKDDTWFVGEVGRPNDIIEATNLLLDPSLEQLPSWTYVESRSTLAPSTDSMFGGNAALFTATSGATAATYLRAPYMPVPSEGWVGFSGWFKSASGNPGVGIRAHFYDATGSTLGLQIIAPTVRTADTYAQLSAAIQAPAGTSHAYAYAYIYADENGTAPSAGQAWLSDGWLLSTATSEASALSAVATYFDGDTPDGTTDNEPHYRWTGTPHASTSEKYLPALSIGDSDKWNVIEQYRHNGTGWERVELSHMVFSSVDLGKATVGELDGIRIMGQTIRGQQLSGDAIDGKVITGGTYRTTGGTGSWSDDGLFIAQPDGTSMVRFPTDGSPLSLTASDVQIDRASITDLDLSYGAVRSGGTVTLSSGVTAPVSPPELTTGWQKLVTLEAPAENDYPPHAWESLAYWGEGDGHWIRTVNIFGATSSDPDLIELFDYATGAFQRSFPIELNPTNGITVMGDVVYSFGDVYSSSGVKSTWIYGYDLNTGDRTSRHEYTRAVQAKNALGNDGTNLIIASVYNRELWVHRRDPVTGVQVGSDMRSGANSWPASGNKELYGVSINGSEVTVVPSSTARVYTVSGGVLTRKTDSANASGFAGWDNPDKNGAGAVFVSGEVYVIDGAGGVFHGYSGHPSDTLVQACFTWRNGTQETTASPVATTTVGAMNALSLSLPVRAGLTKVAYTKAGSGGWIAVRLPESVTVYSEADRGDYDWGIADPPTTNSFPNADPATLKSTNSKFVVKGDGSGTWGPLTFNADGTMTSSQIPDWVPVTSFSSGFGPQTWGFAPAYRVWPDGKVEWRGVIQGNFDTTGNWKVPFTMPNNARPAQAVNTTAAATGTGSLLKRVEFSPTADVSEFRVYSGDADSTWVSLEGLYYYKS